MTIDRIVLAFTGTMILASLVLAYYFGPYWLLLTAFVGLNLVQSAFSGVCLLSAVLKRAGLSTGPAFR